MSNLKKLCINGQCMDISNAVHQTDWTETDTTSPAYLKHKPGFVSQSQYGFMTKEDKVKLDNIEAGAEKNVQSDWNQTNASADDFIKNKPVNVTQSKDGFMSKEDKVKLDGIEVGAEKNVQSDWNQANASADDFIKNKPVNATQSKDGFMSKEDKKKLDEIDLTGLIKCDDVADCIYANREDVLDALGYEEIEIAMRDTNGRLVSRTILAKVDGSI